MAARYLESLDEDALFTEGAVVFRLDVATSAALERAFAHASWLPTPEGKPNGPFCPDRPFGLPRPEDKQAAMEAVGLAMNDAVLLPGLREMGRLTPVDLEMQDGAVDGNWHHDRMVRGHPGAFFLLVYLGNATWDPAWGSGFAYGTRRLTGRWAHEVAAPETWTTVWPVHRTAVLGWNEHPKLVHRAIPLTQAQPRRTAILPLALVPHA